MYLIDSLGGYSNISPVNGKQPLIIEWDGWLPIGAVLFSRQYFLSCTSLKFIV